MFASLRHSPLTVAMVAPAGATAGAAADRRSILSLPLLVSRRRVALIGREIG